MSYASTHRCTGSMRRVLNIYVVDVSRFCKKWLANKKPEG